MKIDYAERARGLVGIPFRAQGRTASGLDCVGVILKTLGLPVDAVRRDYRLRGDHLDELRTALSHHFRRIGPSGMRPGDVMLLRSGVEQLHLAISSAVGFVHAHAGIRRVVETPGAPDWPVLGVYRKRRQG